MKFIRDRKQYVGSKSFPFSYANSTYTSDMFIISIGISLTKFYLLTFQSLQTLIIFFYIVKVDKYIKLPT